MSKGVLPIAAASLVSLLSGVAGTLGFTAEALYMAVPGDVATQNADVVRELRAMQTKMGRLERVLDGDLSAVRRELRAVREAAPSSRGGASPDSSAAGSQPAGDQAIAAHVSRDDLAPLQAANLGALQPLAAWAEDQSVRAKWLFASEAAALASFGAPDEVSARANSEWWTYWIGDGDVIASEYRVKFNNGRLVEAALIEWEKPRRRPTAQR